MSAAIMVEGIGKKYRIGLREQRHTNFREVLVGALTAPIRRFRQLGEHTDEEDEIWALRNVSFDVQQGEVVGIIGRNGAGKSTLLKILSRITEPTEGMARIRGRVGSLLEVGTGFHQELTGRENVYLNGAILGMKKVDIDRRFDAIVAFSGIEKFLDTPVKRYSSGMYVRLAFAVAAHLEPEILIVDEVLAVGDHEFQRKCLGKMQDVAASEGRTILFVSHNLDAILSLCSHVVVLDGGRASPVLPPEEGVKRYLGGVGTMEARIWLQHFPCYHEQPRNRIFREMVLVTEDGPGTCIASGAPLCFRLHLEHLQDVNNPDCAVVLTNERRQRVAVFHTRYQVSVNVPNVQEVTLECRVPSLPLVPGSYGVDLVLSDGHRIIERIEQACRFDVQFADLFGTGRLPNANQGCVVLPCDWVVRVPAPRKGRVADDFA